MTLIFGGRKNSLISRRTNKRLSYSSAFSSLLPTKYLSSLNLNLLLNGETTILFKLFNPRHHSSPNSFKLAGKYISSIIEDSNADVSIVFKLEFSGISTFLSFLQPENAEWHIFVTVDGIEISSIADN